MLARVQSYLLSGIDALPCEVEVDFDNTSTDTRELIVGLPDAGVKEALQRVRAALANSGYTTGNGRLLVNLAPADLRKEGPVYDLPIALGLLISAGAITMPIPGDNTTPDLRRYVVAGELALDGRVRPIKGVIALAALARQRGCAGVIVPAENAQEAAAVPELTVLGVRTLSEVVGLLTGHLEPTPASPPDLAGLLEASRAPIDFADVRGQEAVKRAIVISASGSHNLFPFGPSSRYGLQAPEARNRPSGVPFGAGGRRSLAGH